MKMFCDCMKDATAQSVHVPTALGNDKKRKKPDDEVQTTAKSWSLPLDIKKTDPDQQLIFGWASVVEKDGHAVIDKQGDIIPIAELENAAYEFTLNSRDHGDMHARKGMGKLVESMVFTKEKQVALGIDIGQVGWWVGFKVHDEDLWAAHKRGERPEFSIGGAAIPYEVDDNIFKSGGRKHSRFPFDLSAAGSAHHVIERLLAHQQHKLLREYSSQRHAMDPNEYQFVTINEKSELGPISTNKACKRLLKASDRVNRITGVLNEQDTMLENTTRSMVDHITRAAQRTGAKATESLVGHPDRLLKPEEQARLRAMHSSMADNVDYWTKTYGKKRAAELVGRMYNANGELIVKPDAEWNIIQTTNEVASRLIGKAIENDWGVDKLARELTKTKIFDTSRAETIARTEISRAQNLAMLKAGYEYRKKTRSKIRKVWLLGPDPCPICEENGGEVLKLDEVFESGDFAPPVHPNCMCEVQLIED